MATILGNVAQEMERKMFQLRSGGLPEMSESVWIYSDSMTAGLLPTLAGTSTSTTVADVNDVNPVNYQAPAREVPRPVGTVPVAPPGPDKEWLALMKQLKLQVSKKVNAPFAAFLQREEIVCYQEIAVIEWLDKIASEKNKAEPNIAMSGKPYRPMQGELLFEGMKQRGDESTAPHYTDPIPKEVLGIAATIKCAFPDALLNVLYVRAGDPFLKATVGDERFIVAMWDEPGFTIVKQ